MNRNWWVLALVWAMQAFCLSAATAQQGKCNLLAEGASFEVAVGSAVRTKWSWSERFWLVWSAQRTLRVDS